MCRYFLSTCLFFIAKKLVKNDFKQILTTKELTQNGTKTKWGLMVFNNSFVLSGYGWRWRIYAPSEFSNKYRGPMGFYTCIEYLQDFALFMDCALVF